MNTFAETRPEVIVGVDTHGRNHVASVINYTGKILDTMSITANRRGFKKLIAWANGFGTLRQFGVEGTGSYGAGLARFLAAESFQVIEVSRPNRQRRRRLGKSDSIDAEAAARAVLAMDGTSVPKSKDGNVEMIRMLRVARKSAVKARTQAMNQIHQLLVTSPESVRCSLGPLRSKELAQVASRLRPGPLTTNEAAAKHALRSLGRRWVDLDAEIAELDTRLDQLVEFTAPALTELMGVGTDVAGALLVAAGDNPERLKSEASFAALCGVSPVEASSGRVTRHRLNRGGDRCANNALWRVVFVRMSRDQRTKDYVARRTLEGHSRKEIIRCLKRYVAREIYQCMMGEMADIGLAA